jgi:hypothetical protein
MNRRLAVLVSMLLVACASAFPQTNPAPATAADLSHDRHDGMDVSVDPYSNSERAKEKFGKANPLDAGILPVEVLIRNETDQAVRLKLDTIQLSIQFPGGRRQDIDSLSPVEVADLIAHPGGTPEPKARRLPVPLVSKDKKTQKLAEILQPLSLDSDVVPPKSTIHGFLFFNLSRDMSLVGSSSLYIPDALVIPTNQPMMFFEVPLRKTPPK